MHSSLQPHAPQGTFGLLLEDVTALLVHLDARGAAALAGLRRGDRVLCVDGAPPVDNPDSTPYPYPSPYPYPCPCP